MNAGTGIVSPKPAPRRQKTYIYHLCIEAQAVNEQVDNGISEDHFPEQ